jgi:hypothetical protein
MQRVQTIEGAELCELPNATRQHTAIFVPFDVPIDDLL